MGLKICSLASGSTGNCIYVASDTTKLLIDIGVPCARVESGLRLLGCKPDNMNILVTHTHSDHVSGVRGFLRKNGGVVYCHYASKPSLSKKAAFNKTNLIEFGDGDFFIGDITVSPFKVSHDVPCIGYSFYCRGKKISVATDLGYIGNGVLSNLIDSDLVLLEANHDENLVRVNAHYAAWLKKRILSEKGHLSNRACGEAAVKLAKGGVRSLILAHLSQENNYPELAFTTVSDILADNGIVEGKDVKIEVALKDRMSGFYEVV